MKRTLLVSTAVLALAIVSTTSVFAEDSKTTDQSQTTNKNQSVDKNQTPTSEEKKLLNIQRMRLQRRKKRKNQLL